MGLLEDFIKGFAGSAKKLVIDERINDYRSNFFRYQDMMTQITIEMDKALLTFSIAALAALAALSGGIFGQYGWLSFFVFTCFVGVIVSVIFGFFISKMMLADAQKIITANFKRSLTEQLGKGLEKVKYRILSKVINTIGITLFIIGMSLFILLMALYIRGIN